VAGLGGLRRGLTRLELDGRPRPPPRDIDSSVGFTPCAVVGGLHTGVKCWIPPLRQVFFPTELLFADRAAHGRPATGFLASRAIAAALSNV
jgi:hypothetical protein